ncbi:hypothetical protein ASB57_08475 [Bordetella sp. N]|nr:hypothetical protein ASB57_08475 [Bordetella sp. N]
MVVIIVMVVIVMIVMMVVVVIVIMVTVIMMIVMVVTAVIAVMAMTAAMLIWRSAMVGSTAMLIGTTAIRIGSTAMLVRAASGRRMAATRRICHGRMTTGEIRPATVETTLVATAMRHGHGPQAGARTAAKGHRLRGGQGHRRNAGERAYCHTEAAFHFASL